MKRYQIVLLVILIVGAVFVVYQQHTAPYQHCEGAVFGTYYNITYQSEDDLQPAIVEALTSVDASLSMFNPESTIAKLNGGEELALDKGLAYLLPRALKLSETTNGAFDITVAPLVNVWGFGFKEEEWPSEATIDSILTFVGYEKIHVKGNRLVKDDARTMLDFSAIAKGYGVDVVAEVMEANKVRNYMIEIGGDVIVKGKSSRGEAWRIGVSRPTLQAPILQDCDTLQNDEQGDYQCILNLTDCAVCTSGNYRNFFYKDGIRFAHTIDPHTGHPIQGDVLSATIIAPHCYEADAYATAAMVLGLEGLKEILAQQKHLEAYIIYITPSGDEAVWTTEGFDKYVNE